MGNGNEKEPRTREKVRKDKHKPNTFHCSRPYLFISSLSHQIETTFSSSDGSCILFQKTGKPKTLRVPPSAGMAGKSRAEGEGILNMLIFG